MDNDKSNSQRRRNELNAELRYFASMGDADECRKLVRRGADVRAADGEWTPLRNAVVCGHASVCALLLAHGANLQPETSDDLTLFQQAIWYGQAEVVDYFVREHGEGLDQMTAEGQTLIELAQSSHGNEEMVMHLLALRSDETISALLNSPDDAGIAPIHQRHRLSANSL